MQHNAVKPLKQKEKGILMIGLSLWLLRHLFLGPFPAILKAKSPTNWGVVAKGIGRSAEFRNSCFTE